MTTMITEVYDALLDAGASDAKARKAAETLANYDNRLSGIETRLAVLTWAVTANVGLTLLVVGTLFTAWSKLGEMSGQLAQLVHAIH